MRPAKNGPSEHNGHQKQKDAGKEPGEITAVTSSRVPALAQSPVKSTGERQVSVGIRCLNRPARLKQWLFNEIFPPFAIVTQSASY